MFDSEYSADNCKSLKISTGAIRKKSKIAKIRS